MEIPKDKLGNEIKVGSIIVYGHNLGRCAGLRIGIIKEIKLNNDKKWKEDMWKFKIRGIDDDWFYKNPWDYSKLRLLQKDSYLTYVTRMIVLENVPIEYINILTKQLYDTI